MAKVIPVTARIAALEHVVAQLWAIKLAGDARAREDAGFLGPDELAALLRAGAPRGRDVDDAIEGLVDQIGDFLLAITARPGDPDIAD